MTSPEDEVPTGEIRERFGSESSFSQRLREEPDPEKKDKAGARAFLETKSRPWIGNEKIWSPSRIRVAQVVYSTHFESLMNLVIAVNTFIVIYEADFEAQCFPKYAKDSSLCPFKAKDVAWIRLSNFLILIVYTLEGVFRLYADRVAYFKGKWSQLDILVIAAGWMGEIAIGTLSLNITYLRMVRLARLIRAARILLQIRELYLLLNGVVNSMKAIFFGTGLLFGMLLTYSIVLVEFVHPHNSVLDYPECPECNRGFKTVAQSVLTLFQQLVAGDSWLISPYLIDGNAWIAPIMIFIVVTITLGIMNLILTVIVERAAEAREKDTANKVKQKTENQDANKRRLLKLCQELDSDQSGTLTIQELLSAFETSEPFRNLMAVLDVQEGDLEAIFKILDMDGSGDLDYEEFCDELVQLESQDTRMMIALTRFSVQDLRIYVEKHVEGVLTQVASKTGAHESRFDSIENKLDFLLGDKSELFSGQTQKVPGTSQVNPPRIQQTVVADEDREVLMQELKGLQQGMQSLALLQSDLARETDDQVSALLCHAEVVASCIELLPQDDFGELCRIDAWKNLLPEEELTTFKSSVAKLRQNTSERLIEQSATIKGHIESASVTLDANRQLLDVIMKLFPNSFPDPLTRRKEQIDLKMAPISSM